MKNDNVDPFLFSYHRERLMSYRSRLLFNFEEAEEEDRLRATREFYHKAKFWQYNVPFHELKVLSEGEIFEKNVREFDLIEQKFVGQKEFYKDVFNRYLGAIDDTVFDRGLSFIFYGLNESGKTIAALHALCTAIERGMTGYYISFKDLMHCHNNAEFSREGDDSRLWSHILNCDFLVVDEVGKESSTTDNVRSVFEKIVKDRSSDIKPTILVTNINVGIQGESGNSLLLDKYGNSVYNSLFTRYRAFEFAPRGRFREKTRESWEI